MSRDSTDEIAAAWAQELPGVVGEELELAKRAARLAAILGDKVNAELARLGLTKAEYEILAVLRASGSPYRLRPSDLATRLMLSSGGTSNLVRRLTEAKLLDREADPADARSSWVRLTKPGVQLSEEAVRAATAAQATALAAVPEPDRKAAIAALRQVLLALGDRP
ncbi:DNA-binding MarR family transcriptional regulator [Hamadaea flava]|uniref:MarR family winged helix-turn-helix transcriptional regulator n=1 Tax=Hamadaea flava TaxID=1742688 RepID=A0ABV8M1L5_9ACTN|nr:MarR family transcriptional regulator [Hamadaea flava]MCP2324399.1 DNA-binding MarR family transcriptional regulator [Hamadaea flava]